MLIKIKKELDEANTCFLFENLCADPQIASALVNGGRCNGVMTVKVRLNHSYRVAVAFTKDAAASLKEIIDTSEDAVLALSETYRGLDTLDVSAVIPAQTYFEKSYKYDKNAVFFGALHIIGSSKDQSADFEGSLSIDVNKIDAPETESLYEGVPRQAPTRKRGRN